MDDQYIVSKINEYLHQATGLLVAWLDGKLRRVSDDWWNECVLDRLSYRQREIAIEKGFNKKIQPKIDLERGQPAQQSAKNAQQKPHPI